MMNIIKTAIVTIIISFISGVLLDYYKNYAPRIVCTLMRIKSKTYSSQNIQVYSVIVKNTSNKTLHNININVQGEFDNLKIEYARINMGLKYDISHEGRQYNVNIPFLSKDDEFKAKIFVPVECSDTKKPVITLRSPEKFKEIGSYKDKNSGSQIFNSIFTHKKIILSSVFVLIIVYIVILGGEYYVKTAAKINLDNAVKTGTEQKISPLPKTESKLKSSKSKSVSVSKSKNTKDDGTKKLEHSLNSDNKTSNTDSKNLSSSTNVNKTENKKEENSGNSSSENSKNENISTESSSKQSQSGESISESQNKPDQQSSGSDNNQNAGSREKPAESND